MKELVTQPRILVLGKFEYLPKGSEEDPFIFTEVENSQAALRLLSESKTTRSIAGLICLSNPQVMPEVIQLLATFELESRSIIRIMVVEKLSLEVLQLATNEAHANYCLSTDEFESRWREILQNILLKFKRDTMRAQLLKESTQQLRELETLNQNLEEMVQERTQHIEASKEEEDEKLTKGRNLIKFIKELAQVLDFETLLQLVRKDLRKFHRVSEPILVYQVKQESIQFISMNGSQANYSVRKDAFPFQVSAGFVLSEVSQYLANHFARPFGKIFYLPLDLKFVRKNSFSWASAALLWEVGINETEMGSFKSFLFERVESIAITVDRLMLENDLVQFSYRWEKTFDGFRDPIAIVDYEYEVLRSNKKFSDRLDHRKCYQKFAQRSHPCEGCPVPKAVASGAPQSGNILIGQKVFEVHSYPIVVENSQRITNVVNQYVDVTQNRDLYLRMLQSEKIGAIGLLAGHIAHELNNPLTGIRSLAQVLQISTENKALKEDLKEIEKATERSQRIIKNLLDFATESQSESRPVTWENIIEKTSPMLKSAMRLHRQNFHLNSGEAYFLAEPSLMQQVFFNLVNNACQAMKSPGTLTVESMVEGSEIILKIQDTGTGIPDEIQRKIFEPFFTTKKEGLGTGLGLSLSQKIVENFGGKVALVQSSNQGTVFEIRMTKIDRSATDAVISGKEK